MADGEITITMKRTEALALAKIADVGLRVVEALGLVQSTAAAERGLAALNVATAARKGR